MAEKKPLILLVDDEKDFIDIIGGKLNSSGFEAVGALNGEDALTALKDMKPDLVLLDVNMPGLNGVDVLEKLKENPATADTKVVFLTAYGEPLPIKELLENDKKFAQEAGALDYLKKTDDLNEIVKRIKAILARKQ